MTPEELGRRLEKLGKALQNPKASLHEVFELAHEAGVVLQWEMLPHLAGRPAIYYETKVIES